MRAERLLAVLSALDLEEGRTLPEIRKRAGVKLTHDQMASAIASGFVHGTPWEGSSRAKRKYTLTTPAANLLKHMEAEEKRTKK